MNLGMRWHDRMSPRTLSDKYNDEVWRVIKHYSDLDEKKKGLKHLASFVSDIILFPVFLMCYYDTGKYLTCLDLILDYQVNCDTTRSHQVWTEDEIIEHEWGSTISQIDLYFSRDSETSYLSLGFVPLVIVIGDRRA